MTNDAYEVVILLRSLTKHSNTFKDRLIGEIKAIFSIQRVVDVKACLMLLDKNEIKQRSIKALNTYFNLLRAKDFDGLLKHNLDIEVHKFQGDNDQLDQQQIAHLEDIISNKNHYFDKTTITIDSSHQVIQDNNDDNQIIKLLKRIARFKLNSAEVHFNKLSPLFLEALLANQGIKSITSQNQNSKQQLEKEDLSNQSVWFNSQQLKAFNIDKTNLSIENLKHIKAIFTHCRNIRSLSLQEVIYEDDIIDPNFNEALEATLDSIGSLQMLKEVALEHNQLSVNFISKLAPNLARTKVEVLILIFNQLRDQEILELIPFFTRNQHIRVLNLGGSKLSQISTAMQLARSLDECPRLEEVHMAFTYFNDVFMAELSKIITPQLKVLNLAYNNICKPGLDHLKDQLQTLKKSGKSIQLVTLCMNYNGLNDMCFETIQEIIACCPQMKTFYLNGNQFNQIIKLLGKLMFHTNIKFR